MYCKSQGQSEALR